MAEKLEKRLAGTPPSFGHPMLEQFCFDPSYINLNNGSFGSIPRHVMEACQKLSWEIEANADRYMRITYIPLLTQVRTRVAKLIHAETDECVMIPNATHGVNTVLRNLDWSQSDVIVSTSVTYNAVARTIQYISDMNPRPEMSTFALIFPTTKAEILSNFRTHLKGIARNHGRKVVAVIDSLVSNPGILLPWAEMVKICKEEGVVSVIDAAHSIGQEVNINMKEADPDFWTSNCHKWLFAKRASAVLYVPKRNQHLIKTTLPTSHYYVSPMDPPGGPTAPNFIPQFYWTGTLDLAPYLSVSHALDFREWIGGEGKINEYCNNLAIIGGKKLAEILGTSVMDETSELTANMTNVVLPLNLPKSTEINTRIRDLLLNEYNMYAAHFYHNNNWWVRCSAQIWNEISDFEKLGEALLHICKKIEEDAKSP